jgi:signal transduction histidine kinase
MWGFVPEPSVLAAGEQKKVLAIYSMRREAQLALLGDQYLPRILQSGLGPVDFYSEYIDAARFSQSTYQDAFRDYLALKYESHRFDLVIAVQDLASDFVAANRSGLFRGVPIVFAAQEPPRASNSTAVHFDLDLATTVDFATRLQPETEQVFVVTGASARDKYYEDVARTQFRPFEDRLTFTYLSDLAIADLEERLAHLPDRSIVYYLLFYQDKDGLNVDPIDYLDRVSGVANRPIYSWTDSTLGRGVVGGSMRSARLQMEAIGNQALAVLRSGAADVIPGTTPELDVEQVDWREVERWGIAAARVPAETVINFRIPGAWDRYRGEILAAFALILAQLALISALLVQRSHRRRAEQQVRAREAELRVSYQRVRDMGTRLLDAQEAERSRIARELHDDVGQQLAVLTVDVELLRAAVRKPSHGFHQLADETLERLSSIAQNVHDISHRLHPSKLRLIGLTPALAGLSRELSAPQLKATFTCDGIPDSLPHDLALCMYRVAQEAVQNAARHSGCRNLLIRLAHSDDRLVLTVVDDGVGFDSDRMFRQGLGLVSMRERLEAVGGTLMLSSSPGNGTCVEAVVPFVSSASEQPAAVVASA